MELHPGPDLGLSAGTFVVVTTRLAHVDRTAQRGMGERVRRWFQTLMKEDEPELATGLAVQFDRELRAKLRQEFEQDLDLFVATWRVAESSLRLQDRLVRERMDIVKSYGPV